MRLKNTLIFPNFSKKYGHCEFKILLTKNCQFQAVNFLNVKLRENSIAFRQVQGDGEFYLCFRWNEVHLF